MGIACMVSVLVVLVGIIMLCALLDTTMKYSHLLFGIGCLVVFGIVVKKIMDAA